MVVWSRGGERGGQEGQQSFTTRTGLKLGIGGSSQKFKEQTLKCQANWDWSAGKHLVVKLLQ